MVVSFFNICWKMTENCVGNLFFTYSDFEVRSKMHKISKSVDFCIADSRTLVFKERLLSESELIFSFTTPRCDCDCFTWYSLLRLQRIIYPLILIKLIVCFFNICWKMTEIRVGDLFFTSTDFEARLKMHKISKSVYFRLADSRTLVFKKRLLSENELIFSFYT